MITAAAARSRRARERQRHARGWRSALYAGLYVLAVNSKVKPLDNPLVKQALSLAIDRDVIVKELWRGRGIVPNGPIAKGDNHFDTALPPLKYDPKEAREKLQAGRLQERGDRHRDDRRLHHQRQADVGSHRGHVAATPASTPRSRWSSTRCAPRRTATSPSRALWWSDPTSTLGDPDGMMWRLLAPGGPQDYWRHAKFDELGEAARFSVDEKFRGQAYKEMTKIFAGALPVDRRHPALRGLRAAEVRRVHAEPQPADRAPALQLQAARA